MLKIDDVRETVRTHRSFGDDRLGLGAIDLSLLADGAFERAKDANAKARGVYQGRKSKISAPQLAAARELIESGVPKARVARQLRVDRSTLYRALARDTAKRIEGTFSPETGAAA